jgi:hypothetical protein
MVVSLQSSVDASRLLSLAEQCLDVMLMRLRQADARVGMQHVNNLKPSMETLLFGFKPSRWFHSLFLEELQSFTFISDCLFIT